MLINIIIRCFYQTYKVHKSTDQSISVQLPTVVFSLMRNRNSSINNNTKDSIQCMVFQVY